MNKSVSAADLGKFRNYLGRVAEIPDDEWAFFSHRLAGRQYRRQQFLIQAGAAVKDFYFITRGLVRYFYLTEAGKEFNKAFAVENEFVGALSATVLRAPCRYSVQALEETDVVVVPVEVIRDCYDRHPAWERVGRWHAQSVAVKKELREGEFLLDSAQTRYRRLLSDYPALLARVPQYHLASYLGITEVSLSRIRSKIGLTKVNDR